MDLHRSQDESPRSFTPKTKTLLPPRPLERNTALKSPFTQAITEEGIIPSGLIHIDVPKPEKGGQQDRVSTILYQPDFRPRQPEGPRSDDLRAIQRNRRFLASVAICLDIDS